MKDIGELRSAVQAGDAVRAAQAVRAMSPVDREPALRYCRDILSHDAYVKMLYHACVWVTDAEYGGVYDTASPTDLLSNVGLMSHVSPLTLTLFNTVVAHIPGGSSEERILERALERAVSPLRTQYVEAELLPWLRKAALEDELAAFTLERVERVLRERVYWARDGSVGTANNSALWDVMAVTAGLDTPEVVAQAASLVAQTASSVVRACARVDAVRPLTDVPSRAIMGPEYRKEREDFHATAVLHRLIAQNLV